MSKISERAEKLEEMREGMKKLHEEITKKAKEGFQELVRDLFEDHPTLISFGWRQYTPYFNDGDPCYFNAWTEDISLQTADDEEDDFSLYGCTERDGDRVPKKDITPFQKAGLAVLEVLGVFDEDDYEQMFGDHCRVVVTQEGVEVEEYGHE